MRSFSRRPGAVLTLAAALCLPGIAAAQTPLKFSFDLKFEAPAAPFLLPLDRGYYKAEALDVTIDPGGNSIEAITRVASGTYDMGFADINAMIQYRDQNPTAPLIAVFMVYNKPPYAIVGRKSRGVSVPKDLEGKKLGAPAADSAFTQWKLFVKLAGIDAAKVMIDNIGQPVREPMLAAGQVDAITGASFLSSINLKDRGVPADDITVLLMTDYGVELYGHAIIVNQKFAAEKPEAVKGFLRAFVKGLRESVRDPVRAIDSVLKRNEAAKKDVEIERLRMAIRDSILTTEVKANGFGAIDPARFDAAIEQLAVSYEFKSKTKPKAADVFDASFLPSAAERKAN